VACRYFFVGRSACDCLARVPMGGCVPHEAVFGGPLSAFTACNGQRRHASMAGIEGKVVAITGASSGIGEATALHLAQRGAIVVLGARRPERLEALCARIASAGGKASYRVRDVKRREDLSRLVELALQQHGKLDVLINNAGIAPISLLDELRVVTCIRNLLLRCQIPWRAKRAGLRWRRLQLRQRLLLRQSPSP
jgi:short chain dehydrogenase